MALTEEEAAQRAEAEVRAFCGWHVAPEKTETLVLDGTGTAALLLPTLRVTQVSRVVEDGRELDPDSYEWSASGVVRKGRRGRAWTDRFRGVEITLTHGYPELPLDLAAIVDRLKDRQLQGSQVLAQVGSVSYATGEDGLPVGGSLSSLDRAVLDRYKLPPRP